MKTIAVILFAAALASSSMAAKGLVGRQGQGSFPGSVLSTGATGNTETGTQTSTSPTSSITPQISFDDVHSMTACNPASIGWTYIGPDDLTMSIAVTNQGVDQSSSPPADTSGTPNTGTDVMKRSVPGHLSDGGGSSSGSDEYLAQTLTDTADPTSLLFVWSTVNVPQGWYILQVNITGVITPSQHFFVANGTDMSCLSTSPPSTTSTSSSPTSPTSSAPSETSATSGSTLPVGGSSSSSHVNKGAVAGGVIGGLAVLAAIIAAVVFLRQSSSSRRANRGILGKWGNLGSFDSATKSSPAKAKRAKAKMYNGTGVGLTGLALGVADPQTRKPQRHNSQADSIGPINVYNNSRRTPAGSQDDIYSPYDEKYARSPFGDSNEGVEEMGMIPIGYEPTPSPAGATASHGTKHSSVDSSTYSYAQNNYSRPRSQSAHNKLTPSPQTFPETPSPRNMSNVTLDSSDRRASSPPIPSLHMSTGSDLAQGYVPPSPAYPSGSSGTVFNPSNRPTPSPIPPVGGSGAGATSTTPVTPTARKTPRKPVPTYNPQDPELSYQLTDVPTDVRDHDMHGAGDVPFLHELHHKGSFKQMHYLIPDMPPPQRD